MFRVSIVCFPLAVLAIALSVPSIHAQISQASLQGTVTDNSGAVVRGATVVLKNRGTGESRTTEGIRDTRSGFDFRSGEIVVPSGIPANSQPIAPQLLQLVGDRILFTKDLGLPPSVSPSDKLDVSPRIGLAWSPFGSQKNVFRAAYGK